MMTLIDRQLPWWASFTLQIGVPAAISIFLVWVLVADVKHKLEEHTQMTQQIEQQIVVLQKTMDDANTAMHEYVREQNDDQRRMIQLMRQICLGVSKPAQAAGCGY